MKLYRLSIAVLLTDALALVALAALAAAARVVGDAIDGAEGEDDFELWSQELVRL